MGNVVEYDALVIVVDFSSKQVFGIRCKANAAWPPLDSEMFENVGCALKFHCVI